METSSNETNADPVAPEVLDYAPKENKRAQFYRLARRVTAVGIFVVALTLIESGLDFGYCVDSCRACGARSRCRHFSFFGLGGEYGRIMIGDGEVSKLIQESNGAPCTHQWEMADMSGGGVLLRWIGDGVGGDRIVDVHRLEAWDTSESFLRGKAQADPQFVPELKKAIHDPSRPGSEQFLRNLIDELNEAVDTRPTP